MVSVATEGYHVGRSQEFIGTVYCTYGQSNTTIAKNRVYENSTYNNGTINTFINKYMDTGETGNIVYSHPHIYIYIYIYRTKTSV